MLNWLIIFFIIALISGALGFTGLVATSFLWIFRMIFTVFLILFVISLIMHFLK